MERPRVFISSVRQDFEAERAAVEAAVQAAGATPVMFEHFPSLSLSPRNACLDGVASCDVYLAIVGARGGASAPSGKTIVEEEFEEARRRGLPTLIFLENVPRDDAAAALAQRLSDYTKGLFRKTFGSLPELSKAVADAMRTMIDQLRAAPRSPASVMSRFEDAPAWRDNAVLRIVIAPTRDHSIVDVTELDEPSFVDDVLEMASRHPIGLLSHEYGKSIRVVADELVVLQPNDARHNHDAPEARIVIGSDGCIAVDQNVTGRSTRGPLGIGFADSFVIEEGEVSAAATRAFRFISAIYARRDAWERHTNFTFNAAVLNVGQRYLVEERPGSSFSLGHHERKQVLAFDAPRPLTRAELEDSARAADTLLRMFRRRLSHE